MLSAEGDGSPKAAPAAAPAAPADNSPPPDLAAPMPEAAPPAESPVDSPTTPAAVAAEANAAAASSADDAAPAERGEASPGEPGSEDRGWLGKLKEKAYERVAPTVQKVAEMESVQKGVQIAKNVGQRVQESERVQQGVEFVKKKAHEVQESERFQKGVEKTAEAAKAVTERATAGLEAAREKTKAFRAKAGEVWERGGGTITKVRTSVSQMSWRGNARDTLDIAAREEQWRNIKVQGAEEITVPARTAHTSAYHVSKGSTLRWTFRVKDNDIGFGVSMRVQEWGGSREDEVLAVERFDAGDTISGSWVADEDRTMVLAFDNKYSRLRSKTVAYIVGTEKPPVFIESAEQGSVTASTAASASAAPAASPAAAPAEAAATNADASDKAII